MRKQTSPDSWNNIKRLINDYGKEHWKPLVAAVLFALVFSLSPYVYGFLSRIMLDDVLEIGSTETVVDAAERLDTGQPGKSVEEKLKLLALMFLFYVGVHILLRLQIGSTHI